MSKFKKTKEDNDCVYLKHQDGHEIRIAKSPLSKDQKQDLSKLPIHAYEGYKGVNADASEKNDDSDIPEALKPPTQSPVVINVGAPAEAPSAPQVTAPPAAQPNLGNPNELVKQAMVDKPQEPPSAADQAAPQDQQTQTNAQPDQTAQASTDQPQAPSALTDAELSNGQDKDFSPQTHADIKKALDSDDAAWAHDIANGHIKPKSYQDLFHYNADGSDKTTLGQIGMLFGLMIGGMGSGLTHQPNVLLEMMNKQIDRDLDAQKGSKGNAVNFLHLAQQGQLNHAQIAKFGAETESIQFATAKTKMLLAAYGKLGDTVDKLPEGPQKQNAQQALAKIADGVKSEVNNINDKAATAAMNSKQTDQDEQKFKHKVNMLRALGAEPLAKSMEEKHFPGLKGEASLPLSSEERNQINSGLTFQQQMSKFIDWTSKHSGSLSPSDINEGRALAAQLQGSYRMATHGGVYKSGEQDFISKIIDDEPTKFFNKIRVMPQLKAVQKDSALQLNQLVRSKGFEGYQNQESQESPDVKTMGGVKYIKVPGGWKKQ